MKAIRLRSAGSSFLKVAGMATTGLHIGKPRQEVGLLVPSKIATTIHLGTAFVGRGIKEITPKSGLITPSDSSLVPLIDETLRDHIMNISVETAMKEQCVNRRALVRGPRVEKNRLQ